MVVLKGLIYNAKTATYITFDDQSSIYMIFLVHCSIIRDEFGELFHNRIEYRIGFGSHNQQSHK